MIPISHDSGTHLTTTRISRLLRPLRTKCKYFATNFDASKPRGVVAITYASSARQGSRRTNLEEETPPLAIIRPPIKLSSLSGSDRPTRDAIQLSKAIYDIRDAFKNVIQVSFGTPSSISNDKTSPQITPTRVSSLASVCAGVIGDHIEDQVRFHDEEDEAEDEEAMNILNELYDSVPLHYRRYTVVGHALSLILGTCPRHPSLLYLLLEVSLLHNLEPASHTLLRQLLDLAFRPQPASFSPRVKHPAHLNYLTTLLETCSKPVHEASPAINERAFVRAVVDVLIAAPDPMAVDAWTCKAVTKLARRVLSHDFAAFTAFPASLVMQISGRRNLNASRASRVLLQDPRPHEDNRLTERLTKWLDASCRYVYNHQADIVSDNGDSAALIDLLRQATKVELEQSPDESEVNPTDLVVCLCTLWLASPASTEFNRDVAQVIDFLRRTEPGTSTYTTLIMLALPSASVEDSIQPLSEVTFSAAFNTVDHWAKSLSKMGCYLHEASIWASFLSHVERLLPETGTRHTATSGTYTLEDLRLRILSCLEDAERRSFGDASIGTTPRRLPAYTPRKTPGQARRSQWRWEESFDCWVAKTPATGPAAAPAGTKRARSVEETCSPVKRRRLQDASPDGFASHLQRRRAVDDSALRGRRVPRRPSPHSSRTSSSLSPTPPARRKRVAGLPPPDDEQGEDGGDDEEGEVVAPIKPFSLRVRPLPDKGPGHVDRRQTIAFQTVVADALRNKVVLHRHPRRHSDCPVQRAPVSPIAVPRHQSSEPDDEGFDDQEVDDGVCAADQLSSDDALDLFAYMSSEC